MTEDHITHEEWLTRNERLAAEQVAHASKTPNRWIPSPELRLWIYGVILAVVPLLVLLGIVTEEVGGHIVLIAAAVLSVGANALALANIPRE